MSSAEQHLVQVAVHPDDVDHRRAGHEGRDAQRASARRCGTAARSGKMRASISAMASPTTSSRETPISVMPTVFSTAVPKSERLSSVLVVGQRGEGAAHARGEAQHDGLEHGDQRETGDVEHEGQHHRHVEPAPPPEARQAAARGGVGRGQRRQRRRGQGGRRPGRASGAHRRATLSALSARRGVHRCRSLGRFIVATTAAASLVVAPEPHGRRSCPHAAGSVRSVAHGPVAGKPAQRSGIRSRSPGSRMNDYARRARCYSVARPASRADGPTTP